MLVFRENRDCFISEAIRRNEFSSSGDNFGYSLGAFHGNLD